MESFLFEKPVLIGVLGTIAVVVLAFLWLQTTQPRLLHVLGLVCFLTAAGILLAWWVVTDREQVDTVLHEAAEAVERNDLDAVLALLHAESAGIREQARAEFPNYEFDRVKIKSNLEITFDNPDDPTEAIARFNVVVTGRDQRGLMGSFHVPRYCVVTFRKQDGDWRLYSYQHSDPREGLLRR